MSKYKSKQLEMLYETALALYEIGAITDQEMNEYNKDCLKSKFYQYNLESSLPQSHQQSSSQ
jgi:DNA-binding transcriptional regulator YiaG